MEKELKVEIVQKPVREDGSEMVCLHLSDFRYSSVGAGAELIRQAMARAIAPALPDPARVFDRLYRELATAPWSRSR